MSNHLREDRIQDYVDDLLCREERAEVEQHIIQCAVCQDEIAAYRNLVADLRDSPREIEPQQDLLAGINARIDALAAETQAMPSATTQLEARRISDMSVRALRYPLAAAAVLLIIVSAALTAGLVRDNSSGPVAANDAPRTNGVVTNVVDARYSNATNELEQELDVLRPQLAPATIQLVEENLRVIDQALAEARAALREDPNNAALSDLMRSAYEKKLDLLRHAVRGET